MKEDRGDYGEEAWDSLCQSAPAEEPALLLPPLTLALGPAGAGKTEWALERFLQADGKAILIVSSAQQAETRAAQLAAQSSRAAADFRSAIYPLHGLVAELLRPTRSDSIRTITRAFQRLILNDVFHRLIRPDDYLGRMRTAPGFVTALQDRIREWKLACLTPEALETGAESAAEHLGDPAFARKAGELSRLFHAYETFLRRNGLRDEEDGLHLAAKIVRANSTPLPQSTRLALIEGFYRFTRAQRDLFAALAGRGLETTGTPEVEVALTLPCDSNRPLLFAAPQRTLDIFRAEFDTHEILLPLRDGIRPPVLAHLSSCLFGGVRSPGANIGGDDTEMNLQSVVDAGMNPRSTFTKSSFEDSKLLLPELGEGRGEGEPAQAGFVNVERHFNAGCLQIFDAPNPYVEAEMTAREFRRLYDSGGYAWSDFAVILRAMGDYAPILSSVFERYGIPLGVDGPEKLAENPLLKTLLHLLNVARHGWQRDDVLAFLKSSYTAPDRLAADSLRRRAQAAGVREGRERWLKLAQEDSSDDPDSIAATLQEMARFDRLLTEERAAPIEFIEILREIITAFGLEERILMGERTRIERDRAALREGMEVLEALAQMALLGERMSVTFAQFHADLLSAWQSASSIASADGEQVRVIEPYNARECPLRVAAVMGLTERVFPRRITEDPFFRDAERIALRQAAGIDLEEQKNRADDERFLFYLAVTAPSERLTLSFPRSSQESDTLPSFYLDEVRAVFDPHHPQQGCASRSPNSLITQISARDTETQREGKREERRGEEESGDRRTGSIENPPYLTVSRTLADVAPRHEEAVSSGDRLLSACADLFDPGSESEPAERMRRMRQAAAQMEDCLADAEQQQMTRAVVASRSLPALPRLTDLRLRADFAGQKTVYSVTELETYNRCPFQYLLRHALKLRPEAEGLTMQSQGTLLHTVLRRHFRKRAESRNHQLKIENPDAAAIRADLQGLLTEALASHSLDAGAHHLRMTQRLLTDALDGFAEREERFGVQFGMTPAHTELAFGFGVVGAAVWEEDERFGERGEPAGQNGALLPFHDPASCAEPLRLTAQDGGPDVQVCGTIDRVDLDLTGNRALVLDYKLGKPPEFSDIQRGLSLQMPLYLLAMERVFDKVGAVACYDSMRESGRRRFHRTEHVNIRQFQPLMPLDDPPTVKPLNREQYAELTKTAEAIAIRTDRAIAASRIEATPGDHCKFCAYRDVCRTTLTEGHDGEFLPPAAFAPPGG